MVINSKTRLNSLIRDEILSNALETSGIAKESRDIIEARADLYQKVIEIELNRVGETQETLRKKYNILRKAGVENFIGVHLYSESSRVESHNYLSVNLSGIRVYLYPNGAACGGQQTHITEQARPQLRSISEGGYFVPRGSVTIEDRALRDMFESLCKRQEVLDAHKATLTATVKEALRRVTTIGKLLEVWPDAQALLPSHLQEKETGTGVALAIETLNSLCGLPK